jgi:hypothetical protein
MKAYSEEVGGECPSGLQTQVNVGRIDERTAAQADEDGTNGENTAGLIRKIVERSERILHERRVELLLLILWLALSNFGLVFADLLVLPGVFLVLRNIENVLLLRQWRTGKRSVCRFWRRQ